MKQRPMKTVLLSRLGLLMTILSGVISGLVLTMVFLNQTREETHTFYAAPVLGVVVDKDMRVLDVEAHGAAARAGLQRGDVIETIEGIPLAVDKARVKQAIVQAKLTQKLTMKIKRGGLDAVLTVLPAPPVFEPGPTPTPVPPDEDYF